MTELLLRRTEEESQSVVTAQVYHLSQWNQMKDDLTRLTELGMDGKAIARDDVNEWVHTNFQTEDPDKINIVLLKGRRVIGFSTAYRYPNPRLAIINHTIITPEEQHKGFVGILNRQMDDTLRLRGVREVERFALRDYGTTIARAYGDRIVATTAYPSSTYFRMRL